MKDGNEAKYNVEPTVVQVFNHGFKKHEISMILDGRSNMKHYITKVWIESGRVYAQTGDGLVANYAISLWKRLASATEQQLNDFYLSYSGIHWPQLDEDLSFEGMFHSAGLCDRTLTEDSVCYIN